MKNYFIILIYIFLVCCSFNESELGVTSNNISQNGINSSKIKEYPVPPNFFKCTFLQIS